MLNKFKKLLIIVISLVLIVETHHHGIGGLKLLGRVNSNINNDEKIKIKVELSNGKNKISQGEIVKVTLKIQNPTQNKQESIKVKLMFQGEGDIIGIEEKKIKEISPNRTESLTWAIKGKSGGIRLLAKITEGDKVPYEINLGGLSVDGEGWFSGDTHTHSTLSDGSGTIKDNLLENEKKGLNFMAITDHNTSKGFMEGEKEASENMLIFMGNEYSTLSGHGVLFNINEDKDYSQMTKKDMVNHIKNSSNKRGLVYIAHPFEGGEAWSGDDWNLPFDGIEVWNGFWGPKQKFNKEAFRKWDELNNSGRRIYGISDTDSHSSKDIGRNFTTVFSKDFTRDGIVDGYLNGNIYGSNGPTIDFSIKEAIMGEDLVIDPNGENIVVKMKGRHHKKLNKVVLIKNGEEIFVEEVNDNDFSIKKSISVVPGDFLRMEIFGFEEEGLTFDSENNLSAPFAFSNPIFITSK